MKLNSNLQPAFETMGSNHIPPAWVLALSDLRDVDDSGWCTARKHVRFVSHAKGTIMVEEGVACDYFVMMLSGIARVYKREPQGREISLYRIKPGQGCAMTANCLMNGQVFPAFCVAETDLRAAVLDRNWFMSSMATSPGFRTFVFRAYDQQFRKMMELPARLAFDSVTIRLANYLLLHCSDDKPIKLSHGELATEIGTVREVISRKLTYFENEGWITVDRKLITMLNQEALRTWVEDRAT